MLPVALAWSQCPPRPLQNHLHWLWTAYPNKTVMRLPFTCPLRQIFRENSVYMPPAGAFFEKSTPEGLLDRSLPFHDCSLKTIYLSPPTPVSCCAQVTICPLERKKPHHITDWQIFSISRVGATLLRSAVQQMDGIKEKNKRSHKPYEGPGKIQAVFIEPQS